MITQALSQVQEESSSSAVVLESALYRETCNDLYCTRGQAEELVPSGCTPYIHLEVCARTIRAVWLLSRIESSGKKQRRTNTCTDHTLTKETMTKKKKERENTCPLYSICNITPRSRRKATSFENQEKEKETEGK